MKRTELINLLKQINVSMAKSDGPTVLIVNIGDGKGPKSFSLSVQNEFITVTTGRFLFKRRYTIPKDEL